MTVVNIESARSYRCTVWRYHASHRRMLIRVHPPDETAIGKIGAQPAFYLYFPGVMYFQGPLSWMGAEFREGPRDACAELLRQIGVKNARENSVALDRFHLFEVSLPEQVVRILTSADVSRLEQDELAILPDLLTGDGK